MATYSLANERLRVLEDIEREIGAILQNAGSETHLGWGGTLACAGTRLSWGTPPIPLAGTVILELSKEKTNERLLDRQAAAFMASVQHVEAELSSQIRYLTQVGATRCPRSLQAA